MAVNSLSDNTISAYLWGVRAFFACYSELNQNNASLYKADLMERYRPQTVNMRIRALNCFLKSQDIHCLLYTSCSRYLSVENGELQLDGICLVAGLGNVERREGTFDYYMREPIVKNEAKGVAPLVLAYICLLYTSKIIPFIIGKSMISPSCSLISVSYTHLSDIHSPSPY